MAKWEQPSSQTWVELLTHRAKTQPDVVAIRYLANGEDETGTLTYSELHHQAAAAAASLSLLAEPGSRVVILLPNDLSFITTFFGCLYAGLIAVPGYPPRANQNKDRITKVLKQCGGRVIVGDKNVDREEVMKNLANLGFRGVRYVDYDALKQGDSVNWNQPKVSPDDIAFLQYTSGSTSDPKGVCLTHANLLANTQMCQKGFGLYSHTIILSWLPLYHDMGLIGGLLVCVYVGIPFIFMPPSSFVQKPLRWLKAISKYKATVSGGPNFAFDLCVDRYKEGELNDLDLSSIETLYNGAEPIREATLDRFTTLYARYGLKSESIFPCYGLAEATVYVSGGPHRGGVKSLSVDRDELLKNSVRVSEDKTHSLVSSGAPADKLSIEIVNPETAIKCGSNQVGEIWVSGRSVSQGYWNNQDANSESFGQTIVGTPGHFLRTGDLGFIQDGRLFVTGRIKDIIIVSGHNHYPQDLEFTAQKASRAISIAAAFTIDDRESVALVVEVARGPIEASLADEASKIAQGIGAEHEIGIVRIAFVKPGELPRTSSGKIQRRLTRKKLLDNSFDLVASWPEAPSEQKQAPVTVAARTMEKAKSSSKIEDLVRWIRNYSDTRLNLQMAHNRKTFPPHVILDFGDKGLFGMLIPKEFGGLNLTFRELRTVTEQLAAVDVSLAIFIGLNNVLGIQPILDHASKAVKAELLPKLASGRALAGFSITEPGAGSNPKAIISRADVAPDGVLLSGEKIWTGLGSWASHLSVFAKETDERGNSIGISAFLIDPDQTGVSFGPESMTMGVQPIVQVPVLFDKVHVSNGRRLGEPGKGLIVAFEAMNLARFGLTIVAVGTMKRCYQITERYAKSRTINTGTMLENGFVLQNLSRMNLAIICLEKLTGHISDKLDQKQAVCEELYMVCKIAGPEFLWDVVDTTMQMLGGRGYVEANHVPQIFRDARLLRIFEGPTEAIAYHLGALILNKGSSELVANLGGGSNATFARLNNDVKALKAEHLSSDAGPIYQILACGLGELTAFTALNHLTRDDAQVGPWLDVKYQSRLLSLRAQLLSAEKCKAEGASHQASQYFNEVGLTSSKLNGEDWLSNLPETSSPENKGVPQPTDAPSRAALPNNDRVGPAPIVAPPTPKAEAIQAGPPGSPGTTLEDIRHFLRERMKSLRPAAANRVADDIPFSTLGLDSISAVELTISIDEAFKVQLPDTLAWDYPTINKASEFILSKVSSSSKGGSPG